MRADGRTRIAFVSGATYAGGAEKYIVLLAGGLDRERFEPVLVTSGSPGLESLRAEVQNAGVPNETTEGKPLFSASGARLFSGIIKRISPDMICSYTVFQNCIECICSPSFDFVQ